MYQKPAITGYNRSNELTPKHADQIYTWIMMALRGGIIRANRQYVEVSANAVVVRIRRALPFVTLRFPYLSDGTGYSIAIDPASMVGHALWHGYKDARGDVDLAY